jgi:hypothetical protein
MLAGIICLTLGLCNVVIAAETVKLSPTMRVIHSQQGKPLARNDIMPYLQNLYILEEKEYESLPEVRLAEADVTFIGIGDAIHVYDIPKDVTRFDVIEASNKLADPDNGDKYGLVANKIGEAYLEISDKKVNKLRITKIFAPVFAGMKVIAERELKLPGTIYAKNGDVPFVGRVISLTNSLEMEGIYQTAVVNLGAKQGITDGTLLSIYKRLATKYRKKRPLQAGGNEVLSIEEDMRSLALEDRIGQLMIYKVMEDVSLAIISESKSPITKYDLVINELN